MSSDFVRLAFLALRCDESRSPGGRKLPHKVLTPPSGARRERRISSSRPAMSCAFTTRAESISSARYKSERRSAAKRLQKILFAVENIICCA
jgi:hypothetical protein